jgi:transcriptional regulator with XRE-family HTH domain
MNATQQLIALAMDRLHAKTQRELAAKLGLSHGMVAFYVTGRSSMKDPGNIANVCLLIGEEPQKWFAAIAAEDSGEARVKSWARRLGAAAVIALAALLPISQADANPMNYQGTSSAMHIMSNALRWLRRFLQERLFPTPQTALLADI